VPHVARHFTADIRDMRHGEYARDADDRVVLYRCTECGQVNELGTHDYGIATNGIVLPMYVCPEEECAFAVSLVLDGWTPFDLSEKSS